MQENKPEISEAEKSARDFSSGIKLWKNLIRNYKSQKGLARLLVAISEYPLGTDYPTFPNSKEKDLFVFFEELMRTKQKVMNEIMKQNKELFEGVKNNEQNTTSKE